ncbi:MAG: isoprenylcysteine carboxylmethyltransferase family protein [Planctomycetes bacterium]|nr:isoprenylcysteine carboxylmethyltransferase family protein [Planctomycetota bacterium]
MPTAARAIAAILLVLTSAAGLAAGEPSPVQGGLAIPWAGIAVPDALWPAWLALLLVGCLACFAWAMRTFFTKPTGAAHGMTVIKVCGTLFAVVHLVAYATASGIQAVAAIAATIIYLGALGLFWWAIAANRVAPLSAAFSSDLPERLVQHGPYRFVRHPFYASYLLVWSACPIVFGGWWLWSTLAAMVVIYHVAAKTEERKFAGSRHVAAYDRYRSATGMFMPNPFKIAATALSRALARRAAQRYAGSSEAAA